MAASLNAFAALSALYPDGQTIRGGSRLTIYEAEDAWSRLHLPLLAFSTICGTEAILGGFRRSLGNEKASKGPPGGQRPTWRRFRATSPGFVCVPRATWG